MREHQNQKHAYGQSLDPIDSWPVLIDNSRTKCTRGRDIVYLGPWRGTGAGGNKEGEACDGMQPGQGME